jgi:hypothetical protein
MRILYERSGGFAGPAMQKSFSLDSADLPAHEADELHRLIREADLPALARPRAAAPKPVARDVLHYRLTVEDKDQKQSVVVSDPDIPEKVRSLIDWLHNRSLKE